MEKYIMAFSVKAFFLQLLVSRFYLLCFVRLRFCFFPLLHSPTKNDTVNTEGFKSLKYFTALKLDSRGMYLVDMQLNCEQQ